MSNIKNLSFRNIFSYFLVSFFIIFILSIMVCLIDNYLSLSIHIFNDMEDAREIIRNYFLVEVQIAFITLSMSTALTTTSKKVYWEETYIYRLKSPILTNFTALSAYTLATLVDGLIWFIIDRLFAFSAILCVYFSFILTILFLILLTSRMIDANFGRERIKKDLEKTLSKKLKDVPTAQNITMDKGRLIPDIHKLLQVSFIEIDEKELDLVCENMILLSHFDLYNELNDIYNYAQKVLDSDEVKREIDYRLVRDIIHDNNILFFYSINCPISDKKLYPLIELCIHDLFDEAISLWKNKKTILAFKKRTDLYILLTKFLYHKLIWAQKDADYYHIIYLMGVFSTRRENTLFAMDEEDDLGEKWAIPEYKKIDENVFFNDCPYDDENMLKHLKQKTDAVLKRWEKDGYPEFIDEYEELMINASRDY
ncbi:MAG: hypothetical protein K6B41_04025 [Butyrivibrio sp.]|nr:hypothetical protein [Butyrivibrio sp.]